MVVHSLLLACLLAAGSEPRPAWPAVDESGVAFGDGEHDAAVVVGIDRYAFLPQVPGASANAAAWQQWLVRTRGVAPQHVVALRDADATRERIVRSLQTARDAVGSDGTLWFVFVGHGAPAPGGDDGLILGVDTQQAVDSFAARGVAQQEILRLVQPRPDARTVVVFDACFSGRTGDDRKSLVSGLQATLPTRRSISSDSTVLSASDSFAGPLPGVERPAFSYLLLGALQGWGDANADAQVSLDEAFSFTSTALAAVLHGETRAPSMQPGRSPVVVRATSRVIDVASIALGSCPAARRWNGSVCEERCGGDATWNGSSCVARNVACPTGMTWDGAHCKASIECPPGTVFDVGRCVAARVDCPAGSTWSGCECRAAAPLPVVASTAPTTPLPSSPPALSASASSPASSPAPSPASAPASAASTWPWIGAGVGIVGAVAAVGGGAWLLSSNDVMKNPSTTGDEKEAATSGQVGGISLAVAGLVVGAAGTALGVWGAAEDER